jgi:hypothetical protein
MERGDHPELFRDDSLTLLEEQFDELQLVAEIRAVMTSVNHGHAYAMHLGYPCPDALRDKITGHVAWYCHVPDQGGVSTKLRVDGKCVVSVFRALLEAVTASQKLGATPLEWTLADVVTIARQVDVQVDMKAVPRLDA